MKERPTLFNGDVVRAILDGRKTQARRVIKGEPNKVLWNPIMLAGYAGWTDDHGNPVRCPYGNPGDQLWVRETWKFYDGYTAGAKGGEHKLDRKGYSSWSEIVYKSGGESKRFNRAPMESWDKYPTWERNRNVAPWKPSIHMPRWASRIQLEVKSVRVERVQNISDADAKAEGFEPPADAPEVVEQIGTYSQMLFAGAWESLSPGSWSQNDWVWVVEFERIDE